MTLIDARLANLGVTLPEPSTAPAAFLPSIRSGKQLVISGQLPLRAGALVATGLVGRDVDLETAKATARCCAEHVLAQAKATLGDLSRIAQVTKITVFVASAPGFTQQHLVANGASEFLVAVLGDAGRHARSAIGVAALPLDAAVEVEAILDIV